MNILKHKEAKASPLVPIVTQWKIPFTKRLRGRKFNSRGEYIGLSGPPKPIPDPYTIKLVKAAHADAAKHGPVIEGGEFDLNRYRPMPGKVLVVRPPPIKEIDGIVLPEEQWTFPPFFIILRVASNITDYAAADRVLFDKRHKPKPIKLSKGGFYLSPAKWIIGFVEQGA